MTTQIEPSEFQKSLVKEATYLRGKILTAYAQVEFLLADISVKLDLKFPYLIDKRIKAAKRLHERAGFEQYKEELEKVCDELVAYDEMRHFMAHGYIALTTDKADNHEFEMRMYRRTAKDEFEEIIIKTTIPHMKAAADDITEYVRRATGLFHKIYLEKRLQEPEFDERA